MPAATKPPELSVIGEKSQEDSIKPESSPSSPSNQPERLSPLKDDLPIGSGSRNELSEHDRAKKSIYLDDQGVEMADL